MQINKRVGKLATLVVMTLWGVLNNIPFSHVYAASGFIISASSTTLARGAEFDVPVRVDPGMSINAVSANVTYDVTKIEYVSNSEVGTAFPLVFAQSPLPGTFSFSRSTTGGDISGNKLIITLHFKTIADGVATLGSSGKVNSNNQQIALGGNSFNITIGSAPAASSSTPAAPPPSTTPSTSMPAGAAQTTNSASKTDSSSTVANDENRDANGETLLVAGKTTLARSNILLLILGLSVLLLIGAGAWFAVRRRKLKQNANHFPDMQAATPSLAPPSQVGSVVEPVIIHPQSTLPATPALPVQAPDPATNIIPTNEHPKTG